jgi:hypothetical protein
LLTLATLRKTRKNSDLFAASRAMARVFHHLSCFIMAGGTLRLRSGQAQALLKGVDAGDLGSDD